MIGGLIITVIYLFIFLKIKKTSSKIGEKVNKNASKLFSSSEEIFNGFRELKIYKRETSSRKIHKYYKKLFRSTKIFKIYN